MEGFIQDLAWVWRAARTNRAMTAVVTLTLALGIGATVTVFSIVDAWLLRPLSFPQPDRLVIGFAASRERPTEPAVFLPYRSYEAWKARSRSFDVVSAAFRRTYLISGRGEATTVLGMVVSPEFFQALGVAAAHGRTLSERDAGRSAVVLSHGFWERQFGGSPAIVGTHVTMNGVAHEIAGVMPRDFEVRMLDQERGSEVWTLFAPGESGYAPGGTGPVAIIGRLRRGITPAAAQAELAVIHRDVESQFAQSLKDRPVLLSPLQADNTRTVRATLIAVSGAVVCVLLIACMNVGTIQLGRGLGRARDAAIRAALGSGRLRLVRQSLTESCVLAAAGGALGLCLAVAATRVFVAWNPIGTLPAAPIQVDLRAFAFAVGATIVATIACGVLPALRTASVDPMDALRAGGDRRAAGAPTQHSQLVLLAGQVGLSVVLLVATTLLVRTFVRLQDEPLGFDASQLTVVSVSLPNDEFDSSAKRNAYYAALARRIEGMAGVQRVAAGTMPLLYSGPPVSVAADSDQPERTVRVSVQEVTAGFFETLAIAPLAGRVFDASDSATSRPVVVLNESAARVVFRSPAVVGRRLRMGSESREVVGVVRSTRSVFFNTLEWVTNPVVYLPAAQAFNAPRDPTVRSFGFHLHIRSARPVALSAVRAAAASLSAGVAVGEMSSGREAVAKATRQPAFRMALLGWFGGVGLLLAAIGVYGLVSQVVAHRTREIGVRLALGAESHDVVRVVAGRVVLAAVAGAAAGSAAALALGGSMQSLLYGVQARDAVSFVVAGGLLLAVAVAAALVPSWRATRINPTDILRAE